MSEIESKVKRIIAAQLNIGSDIDNNKTLAQLGADSLDAVEIIMALEDEFSIELDDSDAEQIRSVGAAIAVIERVVK
jgi:acyl carrier protein